MEPSPKHAPAVTSVVAETRFTGAIVTCLWPRDEVASVLPAALRLDTAPDTRRGWHPVVFIFGEHDRSTVFYATLALPTGVRFLEFVVAVPYVCASGGVGPGMFVPLVLSGDPIATWSGNAHYGFVKRLVPMEWLGDTFVVSDEGGGLLAHVKAERLGTWKRAAEGVHRALAGAIVLSRMAVFGHRRDGSLVQSRFAWDVDDAWVRPVRATVSIDAPLGDGLGVRVAHGSPAACVEVSAMRWRLSWPESAEGLRWPRAVAPLT